MLAITKIVTSIQRSISNLRSAFLEASKRARMKVMNEERLFESKKL